MATDRPVEDLDSIDGVHNLHGDDGHLRFDVDGTSLDEAIRHLSGFGIRSLVSQPPTLEELFLRHYGDDLTDRLAMTRSRPTPDRDEAIT